MSVAAAVLVALLAAVVLVPAILVAGLVGFTAFNAWRAGIKVPRDGRFVDVRGGRLHYVDQGSGPAIVLVHGLGGQLRNFTYGLTAHLSGRYRVISVDRPGSGHSTAVPGPHPGLEAQAAMIADLIRALDLDRPLLVGHSLGGAVALAVGLDHPAAVRGLALLSPLTRRQDDVPAAFRALMIGTDSQRRIIAWTLAAPLGRWNRARGRALVFGPDAAPDDFDSRGGGALVLRPANFFAASSEVSGGQDELDDMVRRYPTLAVPLSILFARQDRILDPVVHGEGLARSVPGTRLDLIEGGHMFPLTSPETTARWIEGAMAATTTDRRG